LAENIRTAPLVLDDLAPEDAPVPGTFAALGFEIAAPALRSGGKGMQLSAALTQVLQVLGWVFLVPVACGCLYFLLCLLALVRFKTLPLQPRKETFAAWPSVTILKPVCGLEKNQRENLRSTCLQDYPEFQVVFSVQEPDDPVIPLLYEIQLEFGEGRVTVAIENKRGGTNGKINNMIGGLLHAKHEILVVSDSDVRLRPDYLKTIVAPLADSSVGCVCTLYKAACADTWFEKFELLTLNADLMISMVFAHVSGASKFCLGASMALRRSTLEAIGGLQSLADYLVEDYEIGRRILNSGREVIILPYFVDTMVDLKRPSQWWSHQIYWDQNHRSARPFAYLATIIIRSTPFALLYALTRPGNPVGWAVLAVALAIRQVTSSVVLGWGFRDREGLRSLWLLPFRDIASLAFWFLAYAKRTTIWRGNEFILTRDGRMVARDAQP
jgi:ceramide glucosyltransferase